MNNEIRELSMYELDAVSGGKGSKGQELLGAVVDAVGNLAQRLGASNGVVSALYNAACNIDVNAGATHVT
jgi:hypothetical protein